MENDCTLNTSAFLWLKFDMANRNHAATLRFAVCSQFKGEASFYEQLSACLYRKKLPTCEHRQWRRMRQPTCMHARTMEFSRSNTAVESVHEYIGSVMLKLYSNEFNGQPISCLEHLCLSGKATVHLLHCTCMNATSSFALWQKNLPWGGAWLLSFYYLL